MAVRTMVRRAKTRFKRASPMIRRRGNAALSKAKNTAMAYRAKLAAARKRARAGGALPLGSVGLIVAGGGLRGLVSCILDKYYPNLPGWVDPGVVIGLIGLGANAFGLIKGKWGYRVALVSAGALAAGASDIVEDVSERYLLEMLPDAKAEGGDA